MMFSLLFPEELGEEYLPDPAMEEFRSDMKTFFSGVSSNVPEKFGVIPVLTTENSKNKQIAWDEHLSFHSEKNSAAAYVFVSLRGYRNSASLAKIDMMTEAVMSGVKMLADALPSFNFSDFRKNFLKFNKENREKYIRMSEIKKRGRPRKIIE